ncbi:MAG: hypothetical protein M3209_13675 [Acidobacteriota bacterium]|nr:hypothetical protein [Acidobacteriota bacterium]
MTTKILTAALAFFTTFGFSSLLMQFALDKPQTRTGTRWIYNKPINKQVLRFLESDIRNGQERMGRLSHPEWHYMPPFSRPSIAEYSEAVESYINKSGSMDDSELPHDFQIAWREHMKAWRDYSAFLQSLEDFSIEESDRRAIRKLHKEKDAQITATWFEVLKIAGKNYGAYPANAY